MRAWFQSATTELSGTCVICEKTGEQWSEYAYSGNRTKVLNQQDLTISESTNRITKETYNGTDYPHTYDAAGNPTADRVCSSYGYDAENRLVSVTCGATTATYAYDASGRRVKKTVGVNSTVYIFSGSTVIAEKTGEQWKEYVYSGGALLASIDVAVPPAQDAITYWQQNHLSNALATDAAGNELGGTGLGKQGHLPFGEPWYGDGLPIGDSPPTSGSLSRPWPTWITLLIATTTEKGEKGDSLNCGIIL